jgi:hypothetical protein
MRRLLLIAMLLPLPALAWEYNDAPLIVVQNKSPQPAAQAAVAPAAAVGPMAGDVTKAPGFPEWAVTNAAQNTSGNTNPVPATAPQAPVSPTPTYPGSAPAAPAPAVPPAPASPAAKLWPRDTVPIFMKSCVGFHVELVAACSCTITNLIGAMPHDEFLALSANGGIEQDARLLKIRQQCVAAPRRKE